VVEALKGGCCPRLEVLCLSHESPTDAAADALGIALTESGCPTLRCLHLSVW
jgi:hypothetical protein